MTLFYNNFPNVAFQTQEAGPNGTTVTRNATAGARSKGVEVELTVRPTAIFDVQASGPGG